MGTREFHHPHPQGVPRDVRELAWTKGPGTARGQVPLPQGMWPSPVCVSPPGIWQRLSSRSQGTWAGCPGGWHPTAAPWPVGKGQFPAGSRICSCLGLDAEALLVVRQQSCQLSGFGLGDSGEWDGSCCHPHHSECLSQAGCSSGNYSWLGCR